MYYMWWLVYPTCPLLPYCVRTFAPKRTRSAPQYEARKATRIPVQRGIRQSKRIRDRQYPCEKQNTQKLGVLLNIVQYCLIPVYIKVNVSDLYTAVVWVAVKRDVAINSWEPCLKNS
jgi:hypothetical protein